MLTPIIFLTPMVSSIAESWAIIRRLSNYYNSKKIGFYWSWVLTSFFDRLSSFKWSAFNPSHSTTTTTNSIVYVPPKESSIFDQETKLHQKNWTPNNFNWCLIIIIMATTTTPMTTTIIMCIENSRWHRWQQ